MIRTALVFLLPAAAPAHAMCPVCTVFVGAGVGLSRWFGIDDLITGLWMGGLCVSMIFWTVDWLERKQWRFPLMELSTAMVYYALFAGSYYWKMASPYTVRLFGFDRFILGMAAGSLVFAAAAFSYERIKINNGGKAWFAFQKVAWPVGAILTASLALYAANRWL